MQTPSSIPAGLPTSLETLAYYNITATTTQYKPPVTVRVAYNSTTISPEQAQFLQMWLWNTTQNDWVKIPTTVDTVGNVICGVSPHLSRLGITSLQPLPQGINTAGAACSKTIVGKGYKVTISVPIQNQGGQTQNFTLYVYASMRTSVLTANTTVIYSRNITLPFLGVTSVTFNFTANLAYGNYSLSAWDQPIKMVEVTVPGDVGGYHVVNILDVVMITSIYGTKQGNPKFNPNCDIVGAGQVTILDVVACTSHYGQKWS
jgi:hypothetical protein